ncbi:MAG TPA: hypothetical protein VLZ82_04430 [Microbacterium sp.]|nr:hypothetical protein [Microbacterium sp.]
MNGAEEPQDAGQRPHTPGQDPQGSGAPRDRDEQPDAQGVENRDPDGHESQAAPRRGDGPDDGAPLGGDESTEERLEADTAVEEDALKALDPDDTPA